MYITLEKALSREMFSDELKPREKRDDEFSYHP